MKKIKEKIKEKKELSDIPDSLVEEALTNYLKKHKISFPSEEKSQKLLVKEIRAELRKYVGRFQIKSEYKNRIKLLEKNKIQELLKTHTSTKERLSSYPKLIKIIKEINPSSILDLGCGLNPIAIISKINSKFSYYACDIKEEELKLIDKFFKKKKIKGKTFLEDIRKISKFPKADLCLILKTLDIIDTKYHSVSRKIIKNLNCENVIVSFSTKTLSGKPMTHARRLWFEKILSDFNLAYVLKKTTNEIFYAIKKPRHQ